MVKKLLEELQVGVIHPLVTSIKPEYCNRKHFVMMIIRLNDIAAVANSFEQLKQSLLKAYESNLGLVERVDKVLDDYFSTVLGTLDAQVELAALYIIRSEVAQESFIKLFCFDKWRT